MAESYAVNSLDSKKISWELSPSFPFCIRIASTCAIPPKPFRWRAEESIMLNMENKRLRFWYLVVKLAIYVAIAVCVGLFQQGLLAYLKHFIGGLMVFYGLEEILYLVLVHRARFYREDKMYFGFVELVLGVGVLFAPLAIETVCMVWATWSIMREAVEIKEVILELKSWTSRTISLIESIAVIVFSIMLIFVPDDEHATTHLRILTIELILAPLIPLMDLVLVEFKSKAKRKKEGSGHEEAE